MTSADARLVLFSGGPLTISDRCLNETFAGTRCTRCADVCPSVAMRVDDGSPVIDEGACVRCGACLPACPIEAVVPRSPNRHLRFAVADLARDDGVVIACPRGGTHDWGMNVVRHDRCLAALGAEELFELVAQSSRAVWLDDAGCPSCELAKLHPLIDRASRDAGALLRGAGYESAVHLVGTRRPTPGVRGATLVVEARDGGMSRRGLFRRLAGEVSERVAFEAGDGALPERRRQLLRRVQATGTPPVAVDAQRASVSGFGDIVVDALRCSACGVCAKACPTGALTISVTTDDAGREEFRLCAQVARCVDCDVCTVACPDGAITVEPYADVAALREGSSKTIAAGPVAPCEVCGALVAGAAGESKRCSGCRGGVVSPLRDEAGLMADLLGRLPIET